MKKEDITFETHADMEKYLFDKYPIIFGDRTKPMSETCMCWGISCEMGWFKILNELCEEVQLITDTTGIQLVADQVKEKYATLRFYWHSERKPTLESEPTCTEEQCKIWYNVIDNLVDQAEERSGRTCEECGEYGKICGKGWYKTLCKKCADKDPRYRYTEVES